MLKKIKNIFKNEWIKGTFIYLIFPILATLLASVIGSIFTTYPFAKILYNIFNFVVLNIFFVLNYKIAGWLLVSFICSIYVLSQAYIKYIVKPLILEITVSDVVNDTHNQLQMVKRYTADKFDGLVYKWDWVVHPLTHFYEVRKLQPVCGKEGCNHRGLQPYREDLVSKEWICDDCFETYRTTMFPNEIVKKIEDQFSLITRVQI